MSEVVEFLRTLNAKFLDIPCDEILRLEKENKMLREALRPFAEMSAAIVNDVDVVYSFTCDDIRAARAAMGERVMSKRQPYDGATPYYAEKKQSEIEALRAENARLLKNNTALKAALEETYKIASRNEDGEYKWQVIKALSEEDYE